MDVRMSAWVVLFSALVFGVLIAAVSMGVWHRRFMPAVAMAAVAAAGYLVGFWVLWWTATAAS